MPFQPSFAQIRDAARRQIEVERIRLGDNPVHPAAVAINDRDTLTDKATGDLDCLLQRGVMLDRDRIGLYQRRKFGIASSLHKCRKGNLSTE